MPLPFGAMATLAWPAPCEPKLRRSAPRHVKGVPGGAAVQMKATLSTSASSSTPLPLSSVPASTREPPKAQVAPAGSAR